MLLPEQSYPPGHNDIDICCGEATIMYETVVKTRIIINPPRTVAEEILIKHWQCRVVEEHNGDIWEGVHEDGVEHSNIFDTEIDEKEVGNEVKGPTSSQQR